jgi:metal-sulfur cluster biosynthetic enzyme
VRQADIAAILSNVIDPELGIDVVSLGLIYGLYVDDSAIRLTMTVTTPDCPMASAIAQMAASRLAFVADGREVFIEVAEDPPWAVAMLNDRARQQLGIT